MAWIIIYTPVILSYTLHSDRQMSKLLKSRVENCIFAMCRWMDGWERIEAKPWQDGGHAHPGKVLSFSILSVLMSRWWERGVLVLSLISTCLFMHVSNICRSLFYNLANLARTRRLKNVKNRAFLILLRSQKHYVIFSNNVLQENISRKQFNRWLGLVSISQTALRYLQPRSKGTWERGWDTLWCAHKVNTDYRPKHWKPSI